MASATKSRKTIVKILPKWYSCGVDSTRLLGGFLSVWNPKKSDFNAYLTSVGIMLEGTVKYLDKNLKLINFYGPYLDMEVYWETIKREGLLKEHSLILGGDLNFTTSSREVWGAHARSDSLQPYFRQLVQEEGLVDVTPIQILPTRRNGIGGQDYIAKRLDRFCILEDLALSRMRYRTWVCNLKVSDHLPVILHLESDNEKIFYPFKFKSIWLEDPELVNFVRTNWDGILGT
jgi:hypothetical protein